MGDMTKMTTGEHPDTLPNLSISTYNTECIRNNQVYASEIMNSSDIILIQEHWLFQAEVDAKELDKMFPNHDNHAKGVDKYNPLPPTAKVRGYGGVATFWPAHLTPAVKGYLMEITES